MPLSRALWQFGAAATLLCIVSVISLYSVKTLIAAGEERALSSRFVEALREVESDLKDAEAGERGFLLTGDPQYLSPYETAIKNHEEHFKRIRELPQAGGRDASAVDRLQQLALRKQDEMRRTISARRSIGFEAAGNIVRAGQKEGIMTEVRSLLGTLIAHENKSLGEQEKRVHARARAAGVMVLVGVGAAFFMAVAAGYFISGVFREREKAARLLKDANDTLEHRIQERTAELNQQRHFLNAVLDSLDEAIVACDAAGNITLVNRSARNLWSLAPDAPVGDLWTCMLSLHHADRSEALAGEELPLLKVMKGKVLRDYEFAMRGTQSEWRTLLVSGQPIVDAVEGQLGAVIAIRDVTLIRQADESLRARQLAEASNRAKSDFLSRMSHELRTPLNAILGFGQVLQMDELMPEKQESISQILRGGRHLLSLINEVLDLSRIEVGRLAMSPEPVLISEALKEAVELVTPLSEAKNISIHILAPEECARHVFGDRQRIKQILLNLLSNAVKYNRVDGWIRIFCTSMPDDWLRISVQDSGSGIAEDKLHRVFAAFDRLGAEQGHQEGTGLGLCLSKGLAELMGGTMGVESRENEGSTFWIQLRLTDSPVEKVEKAEVLAPRASMPTRAMKVLYIEDNLSNVTLVERLMQHRPNVELISAMQGGIGLDLARQAHPELIFLDIQLPDMTGNEVLLKLRSDPATADIPVVVVSADATPGQIERLLAAGARKYLTKPIDVQEFLQEVDNVAAEVGV